MKDKKKVITILLRWYKDNKRDFIWRSDKISLYKLITSEIFLWKTQANTVKRFLQKFFTKYPNPSALVVTSLSSLAKEIKELGLSNRRAKQLKVVISGFSERNIPVTEREFRKRFRVGQYVARSVLSLRYNQHLFPVDQNILRFFKRVFGWEISNIRKISTKDNLFLEDFIKIGKKRIIWAVIDFSSLVCRASNPACSDCVLYRECEQPVKLL